MKNTRLVWLIGLSLVAIVLFGMVKCAKAEAQFGPVNFCFEAADASEAAISTAFWEKYKEEKRCGSGLLFYEVIRQVSLFYVDDKPRYVYQLTVVYRNRVATAYTAYDNDIFAVQLTKARDAGQWEDTDGKLRVWYQQLMQPDNPEQSCCGEADAYYADKVYTKNGKNYAIITDLRPDGPLNRPHLPPGTVFEIPNHKMKFDRGNPTGHNIIFVFNAHVLCFVDNGGV